MVGKLGRWIIEIFEKSYNAAVSTKVVIIIL
jgi:hypothetical protein